MELEGRFQARLLLNVGHKHSTARIQVLHYGTTMGHASPHLQVAANP